jgi:DnaK suppressor protein
MTVMLSPDYRPSEDEEFMNERMVEYFRRKLVDWRADLLRESEETLDHLKVGGQRADIDDRASSDTDLGAGVAHTRPRRSS